METSKQNMAKDMLWNTIGNLVYFFCQWIMTVVVVRLASYEEAGYFALAMSTSATFSAIAFFSMRNFQVSDVNNEFSNNEYVGSHVLTCTLAFILCALKALNSTNTYQMLCIDSFMLIKIAESIVDVLHGVNQKISRYDLIGKSCMIRGIVSIVVFIFGLVVLKNTCIAILLTAICNLLVAIFYDYRATSSLVDLKPIIWNTNIKKLLWKCLPLMICSFLLSAIPLVAKTALQKELGTEILGKYSSIASPTLIVQVMASYAFSPMLPHISELYVRKNFEGFYSVLKKLLIVFLIFSICMFAGGAILGKIGLTILYGKDILEYYYTFMPLIGCTLMTAVVWTFISIVTAIRKIYWMLAGILLGYLGTYVLADKLIVSFGVNGTSYIHILSFLFIFVWLLFITVISCKKEERN